MAEATAEATASRGQHAPRRAELLLAQGADEGVARMLAEHLTVAGHAVSTRRVLDHRGPESLDWIVLAALPLQAFLSGLGAEAVGDGYRGLKRLVGRLSPTGAPDEPGEPDESGEPGEPDEGDGDSGDSGESGEAEDRAAARTAPPLVLQDPRTGLAVVLEAGLPEEAYERLTRLDLSAFRLGPLHYDRAAERWRSELDEAAR